MEFKEFLAFGFLVVGFIYGLFNMWRKKQLYKDLDKIHGPQTLPIIGNALMFMKMRSAGDLVALLQNLMLEFTPPFRVWLGPFHLFYITVDPTDFETILNNPAAFQKVEMYRFLYPVLGNGLFTSDAIKWKKMRKLIMPAFNQRILNNYVSIFVENSEKFVKHLEKYSGQGNFNILEEVDRCAVDMVCETTMGVSVDAQKNCLNLGSLGSRGLEIGFYRMFKVPYHSDYIYSFSSLYKEENEIYKKIINFTDDIIDRRKKELMKAKEEEIAIEGNNKKSFLDLLLEISEKSNLSHEDIRSEVNTFLFAGSDTSATVISFVFVMLGMHPEIQEKVYEIVMDVVGPDRTIDQRDLINLQYIDMVIKETMRLFPVAPVFARHLLNDIKLEKLTLPQGTNVLFGTMYLHRNPKYWPEPLKFDPLRFLPEEVAKRHPYCYIPFTAGPRNCIGWKYGMMSMIVLIAMVVRKYKLSTSYKKIEDIKITANLVIKPLEGYKLSIEKRETNIN